MFLMSSLNFASLQLPLKNGSGNELCALLLNIQCVQKIAPSSMLYISHFSLQMRSCWSGDFQKMSGTHTHPLTHTRTHTHTHMHSRMRAHTHAHTHTRIHAHTHARMYARMHARTHACTHACTHAHIHTHTHTHTHTGCFYPYTAC